MMRHADLAHPFVQDNSPGTGAQRAPANALRWGAREDDRWLERWIRSTEDLASLQSSHRMVDAVIDEIDGRRIRIGEQWLTDYASCNYLGLDLDREIIEALPEYLHRWGTHPSSSRLLGSPALYAQIEQQLTALLGSEDSLVLPTITHIHMSVIPVLAGGGTVFVDTRAHKTIYDACALAVSRGASIQRFGHENVHWLEALLRDGSWRRPGMICIDGVGSMTGNAPDVSAFVKLAREHDVVLYIDDAHGFGVIGERSEQETCTYGTHGNSVVRHVGESYENIVLVAGFSKAYSAPLAFLTCPTPLKQLLKTAAGAYLYSGPSAVASLAAVLEGLRINEARGEELRARLHRLTGRALDRVHELGIATANRSGFPIIEIPVADPEAVAETGNMLFERGIYATMAVYPLVPHDEVGFRLQITAAHTDEQIDQLCAVLGELSDRFKLELVAGD